MRFALINTVESATALVALWAIVGCVLGDQTATCHPKDFHYEFTECDKWGGRWRVSVPSPGACTGGAPNAPIRIKNCTTSCDAGYYFNASTLSCERCAAGTYSLGGGVVFDTWDSLPNGFHVIQQSSQSSLRDMLPSFRGRVPDVNCSNFGWKTHGDFVASESVPCTSILVYTVKLVKPGQLHYTYQYTDESVVFLFQVQNDQCLSIDEAERSRWPPPTEEGKWHTLAIPLKTGLNVLQWKTIGMSTDTSQKRASVLIKNINISGLAYTSSCIPCASGTYSSKGAVTCTDCVMNTYSHRGAKTCLQCESSQYSEKGSSKCKVKLPCKELDYYFVYDLCDSHRKTALHYKWFQPKICDDISFDAVQLPSVKYDVTCPPCNPGMYYNNSTRCVFCPFNHFSSGEEACIPCPHSMAPDYRYEFRVWNELPPVLETSCLSISEGGCRSDKGWQVAVNHVHTTFGNADDAYLVLEMKVPGFRSVGTAVSGRALEVSRISFAFELTCTLNCEFLFMQESSFRGVAVIESWTGTQALQQYSYVLTENDTYVFSWAFQKRNSLEKRAQGGLFRGGVIDEDTARIYSINVTNTLDGGASECHPCPKGIGREGCIPCPAGYYVDENTTECWRCPNGTFSSAVTMYGITSCLPCGTGLQSKNGLNCFSTCSLTTANGREYDFRKLIGFHVVRGRRLFTASGTEYFHLYNVSICGEQAQGRTTCINNVTSHGFQRDPDVIRSTVCRSTIIPMRGTDGVSSLSAQSVSLGDHLLAVTSDPIISNISVISEFLDKESHPEDLHFFYTSPESTRACPRGRSSTITLRCNVSLDGNGEILLPAVCPDGTCDGCTFHLLWLSRYACPLCVEKDYEVVAGECSNGVQTVHYIATSLCRFPEKSQFFGTKKRKCSSVTQEFQIIIGLTSGVGLLLLLLVYHFWKKNRRLEYKYKKLVQSTSSKEGELPPAESCALHDDEEDHFDSVQFKESKSTIIFSKLRSIAGNKDKSAHPFESLEMSDKDDVT